MTDTLNGKKIFHGDVLSRTLTFLEWKEILALRCVATSWKQAIARAPVEDQVHVNSNQALRLVCGMIPKLKHLKLDQSSDDDILQHRDEEETPLLHNFSNIQQFQCLHTTDSPLHNYDLRSLLCHWQNLQCLNLHGNENLQWSLSDLAPLKHIRDIRVINNRELQGGTLDLLQRIDQHDNAKRTDAFYNLEILDISGCNQVTGKLSHFAQMPKLQWLGITRTQVSGDLRTDVQPGDFVALQGFGLDMHAVYGANYIDLVQDAELVMKARLQIMRQSTWESPIWPLMLHLSPDSLEYHERPTQRMYTSEKDPPFSIEVVVVGKRMGWRWSNYLGGFCDTHWVDPEPDLDDEAYWTGLPEFFAKSSYFSGFLDPPTPKEYVTLFMGRL
jgi:hypothetical protein